MNENRLFQKVFAIVLAVVVAVSVIPATTVEAATYTATTKKKMKTIKKVGEYTVAVPANNKKNYVQFTAPKAGTYINCNCYERQSS